MDLYFTCPKTNSLFSSQHYSLEDGFQIIEDRGEKKLEGIVLLQEPCPYCGSYHRYHSNEIGCPTAIRKKNDK